MVIFDKAYNDVRNKYISILSNYYLQYRQLPNNNIKKLLLEKTQNITKGINDKEYIFYFHEEDLFKSLLGDIFLFYIRSLLQNNDVANICPNVSISPNWNITTCYYASFFDASLLLRLCFRGNVFFDIDYKKSLEILISRQIGEVINIDSNQIYYIEDLNGQYVLKLRKTDSNTHELVWKQVSLLLDEIISLSTIKSDERLFLSSCRNILNSLGATFPSALRNKVNYRPLYGYYAVEKNFYGISNISNWVKQIISYDRSNVLDDNQLINLFKCYSMYIHKFGLRLILDYYEMTDRDNNIIAAINKNRSGINQIISEEALYAY